VQASRKAWYSDRQACLYDDPSSPRCESGPPAYRFACHVHRGDATNAVHDKKKYHNAQSKSYYVEIDITNETEWATVQSAMDTGGGEGDILPVGHGSAEAAFAMYQKQLDSIGCPSWRRPETDRVRSELLRDTCNVTIAVSHFIGADSGGDEAKNFTLIRNDVAEDWNTYAWGGACMLHQYHLMCHKSLKFADNLCKVLYSVMLSRFKYFSSIVKLLHCFRDHSKAIYKQWALCYGVLEASQLVKNKPPQALSGRWGAVGRGEGYVLRCLHAPRGKLKELYPKIVAPTWLNSWQGVEHTAALENMENNGSIAL
jgi:hypothetical protein